MPEIPHDLASFDTYAAMADKYSDTPTHFANPVNFVLVFGVIAIVAAQTISTLSRVALVPKRDPRLADSLRFENI